MSVNNATSEPDWTISELYEKAWKIVKKYKILWIFGLAAGAGGASFNSFSRFNTNFNGLKTNSLLPPSEQKFFPTEWSHVLTSIPPFWWVVLGAELLCVFIFFWIVGLIYSAWANGALIQGINTALAGKTVTISDASEKSFKSIKSLIWLFVVPGLILGLSSTLFGALLALAISLTTGTVKVLFFILMFLIVLTALYFLVYLVLSQIWALRLAVLEGKGGKESLFAGYRIARKKKWAMIGLGLVNSIAGGTAVLVPIAIAGTIFFAGWQLFKSPSLAPIGISLAVLLALPIFVGFSLLSGIISSFKAIVWTEAYKNIRGKYNI